MSEATALPKISIVTPCLNQASYLESAMRSVLAQEYPNLEYIVMDGGSRDGSVEIIQRHAPRLAHWESAPDAGQADAIYRGFQRSTGEILGWLNSDDILLPGCLHKAAQCFRAHPKVECVVGGSVMIDSQGRVIRTPRGLPWCYPGPRVTFHTLLFMGCWGFTQPASFWRRQAFFEVGGFDASLRFCFDYDMYLRLAKRHPFGRLKEFLAGFRVHEASKTSTISDVMRAENELLWRRHGRYERSAPYRAFWHFAHSSAFHVRRRVFELQLLVRLVRPPVPAGCRLLTETGGE